MSCHQPAEGFLFQSVPLSLRSHGREWLGAPGWGLSKAIFGHESALGNFWSKGVPGINDHVCLKRNHILFLSYGGTAALKQLQPLHLFILQLPATAQRRGTFGAPENVPFFFPSRKITLPSFRTFVYVSLYSSARQTAAFNPTAELWLCSTSSTSDLPSFFTTQHLQLVDCHTSLFLIFPPRCLAWLRNLLTLVFFFPLPMSSQPFKLFPENAGTRRKKEKSVLACALQPVTLHNVHWHTGVDCILFSIQTRCEALMYGSVFFFLRLLLKGRQIYAKNVVLRPSSLSDVKIHFRLIPHFPPSARSGWDDTVWFSVIVMLLFVVGGALRSVWGQSRATHSLSCLLTKTLSFFSPLSISPWSSALIARCAKKLSARDKFPF